MSCTKRVVTAIATGTARHAPKKPLKVKLPFEPYFAVLTPKRSK